jgi:acyl-CoA hydrolase/GNAT superfamily N-acetyltransferase
MTHDWRRLCAAKLTTPERAVALIKPGRQIYLSAGSAVPLGLLPALTSPRAGLLDNGIVHLLTLGEAPYTQPEFAGRFRHNALFIGPNVRDAVVNGRADYTPAFLSELPRMIRAGRIPIDVAIVSLSPPDAEGWCSFGTHVDLGPAAIEAAAIVIGAINPRMPRSCGPHRVHIDQADALVECDHPLPELRTHADAKETAAISAHIADLVPDGATLQLGIGSIPDAVLQRLVDRRDLGIHTELLSDGVVQLMRQGVITNRRKTINAGKSVCSFVMGSQATYDFLHENPQVELHASDYVNDPLIAAQHDHFTAINMGLEIDLTGQVCSDSIGSRFYSGIGGQVDFIRGASRSKGGRAILALPSTARNGNISRIVPRLNVGAGVVTTRGDVHWVVTEWGAVNLHGLTVRERALSLIQLAHPKFRPWLLAEAKRLNFVYQDQLEPPMTMALYPREFESRAATRDGIPLRIRAVRPADESLLRRMFYRLSPETVHRRFSTLKKAMPHENLQRACTIDYLQDMMLVALHDDEEVERIVGVANYNLDRDTGWAEAAALVDDEWQGRGIGTVLMRKLTEVALRRGVKGFTGVVVGANIPMLRAFDACGYRVDAHPEGEIVRVRIEFTPARATVEC